MIEIHSFNVEVAKDYSIEKAILLHNILFWCRKNFANKTNIYKGRAYTYNTSEAFAELFPYMTARKIAELLRSMEYDGLLLAGQFQGTNRVKSYTVTDKALEYYTSLRCSNIQENVVATYENTTMEDTENRYSSITDINNTDINTDINIDEDVTMLSPCNVSATKVKKSSTKKEINPKAIELAHTLFDLHKKIDDKCKEPNYEQWAKDIEKINVIDKRSYEDIEKVIRWVKTPGNFWFANIMSGKKLRLQFDRLIIEITSNRNYKQQKPIIKNDVYTGNGEDW